MVFTATFRSVFGSHGLLKNAQHHTHSAVADPNSVIAAKKPLLARLFSCQPQHQVSQVKQAKDTASTTATQQQQQRADPLASPAADAPLVPFHTHAGNTARAALRRSFLLHLHQHSQQRQSRARSLIRPHWHYNCKCPSLFVSLGRHTLACREAAQQAEEEEADDAYHTNGYTFRFRMDWLSPSIVIQHSKAGQQQHSQQQQSDECGGGGSSQLVVTPSSPVYQHIVRSLIALAPSAATSFLSLIPSSLAPPSAAAASLLSASSAACAERDLPDDEKNNDHIPLPTLPHTVHTIEQDGDRYTGQLCALTAQQHGRGVMQYASGDSYAGEWEGGLQHGRGVMCYAHGRYDGQYVRGQRCGLGTWQADDGERYEGEWRAGLRDGKGREWAGDELLYDGEWAANARHGYGVAHSAAGGWRYEGEWVNGVMDGYGSIEYASGEVWEGQWHAGAMHGEGMRISATGAATIEHVSQGSLLAAQPQPPSRQSSEGMGALDALGEPATATGAGAEGVPSSRVELLALLSQVASLQTALADKLSRVEELLVQPAAGKQLVAPTTLSAAVSMAA